MHSENVKRLRDIEVDKNSKDFIVLSNLVRDLKFAIDAYATGKVLDIGCGNKPYQALFDKKQCIYKGCDIVQSDLNKVDIICPANQLLVGENEFDTVFSSQVIEHVPYPAEMIKEAFRVLAPGGKLILSFPFTWELHEEPHDYFRYTKYGMTYLLEQNGFKVDLCKSNGGKWATVFQIFINSFYLGFHKKGLFTKLTKFIFINLKLTMLINMTGLFIDRKFYDEVLCLNYVMVATK